MGKYSVGDKVTIKHDLEANSKLDIVEKMVEYKGQTATIVSLGRIKRTQIYKLDIDRFWDWYEDCFEEE